MANSSKSISRAAALLQLKGRAAEQGWVDLIGSIEPEALDDALLHLGTWVRSARGVWPVIDALVARPRDERIGSFALALLSDVKSLAHTSGKLMRRLLECVELHGDASCAKGVRALKVRARPGTAWAALRPDRLERVALRLERARPAARARQQTVSPSDEAGFLDAIAQAPNSAELRAVYTDWLLSLPSERATFTRLQQDPSPDAAALKKLHTLQRRHQREWLGELWPLLEKDRTSSWGPVVFRAGLLSEVTLGRLSGRPSSSWTAPALATVDLIRFLPAAWKTAAAGQLTFQCHTAHLHSHDLSLLASAPRFPRLAQLELSAVATDEALAAASALEAQTLCFLPPAGGRWFVQHPWRWEALDATSAQRVQLHVDGNGAVATLTRVGKRFDALHIASPGAHDEQRWRQWLRERPPRVFKKVVVDGSPEVTALFERGS